VPPTPYEWGLTNFNKYENWNAFTYNDRSGDTARETPKNNVSFGCVLVRDEVLFSGMKQYDGRLNGVDTVFADTFWVGFIEVTALSASLY